MDTRFVVYTCGDAWRLYRDRHIAVNCAAPERQDYGWKNLGVFFGDMLISSVDWNSIEEYTSLRIAGAIGRPSTRATVRRELAELSAALRWCAHRRRNLISPDIVPDIELPEDSQPRERFLREYELQLFFDNAKKLRTFTQGFGQHKRLTRVERFCYIALDTAARKQAILDLTWDRVDFEAGVIYFDKPGRKKTKKRRAAVPISSGLRKILLRAFRERINNLVMDHGGSVWAPIQNVAIKAGLATKQQQVPAGTKPKATGISPHVFRHTAATRMLQKGVSMPKVARVLGNSMRMVEKVYGHLQVADLADAVEMISAGSKFGDDGEGEDS